MTMQSVADLFTGKKPVPKSNGSDAHMKDTFHKSYIDVPRDLPKRIGYGVERVKLTPELAQYYLTFNRANRAVVQKRVDLYADEMARGEWAEQGDAIRFTKDHELADGQHRCMAVVQSGKTIHVLVVYGLDSDVKPKIDIGKNRGGADILSLQGLGRWESRVANTAIHALINAQRGLPISSAVRSQNHEVENFYLEHPSFKNSLDFIAELPRKIIPIPHPRALVLHYLFAQKDVGMADDFIGRLYTGDSLPRSSPVYQLREKLNEAQRISAKPYSIREQYHSCIKAWNLCRAKKTLSSARSLFPRSDEPLPVIE